MIDVQGSRYVSTLGLSLQKMIESLKLRQWTVGFGVLLRRLNPTTGVVN